MSHTEHELKVYLPISGWVCERTVNLRNLSLAIWTSPAFLPPATKLGQANIFRSMFQEFCPQGGDLCGRVVCMVGGMCGGGHVWQGEGGMHGGGHAWQGGMCGGGACVAGVCVVGGLCGSGGACVAAGGPVWWGCMW